LTEALRWLVVGNGMAGRVHQQAIARIDKAELVGVVSNRAAAVPGVASFPDIGAALDECEVDAAIIATPNHTHLPLAETLFAAGIPILCEKPVGSNATEAARIAELGEQHELPVGVVLNQRFCRANQWVRQLIVGGDLAARHISFELAIPPFSGWHADAELSGGGLLRLIGIHYLDLLCWWLGQPSGFSGEVSGQPVDDRVDVTFQFPGNCTGRLALRANAAERGGPVHCDIEADQGNIEMRGHSVVSYEGVAAPPDLEPSYPDQWFGPGHMSLLREATESLVTSGRFPISLTDALPSLTVMQGVYGTLHKTD
jgi:predicted dehydrogenase